MAVFPSLQSGAVCQYPSRFVTNVAVEVLRFLDGSDQRFCVQGSSFRQWQITLNLLTSSEAVAVEQFFVSQHGVLSTFDFPDPMTGSLISNCRFGDQVFLRELNGSCTQSLSLWVVETHG